MDYFSLGAKILGIVCEGDLKDVLEHSGMALVCDPDDVPASSKLLYSYIAKRNNLTPDIDYLQTFSLESRSRQLLEIVDNCL